MRYVLVGRLGYLLLFSLLVVCLWSIFSQKVLSGSPCIPFPSVGVLWFPIGPLWYIGKLCTYSTIWEKNVVVILHIYGARAIFLLFYDHQDTESASTNINTEKNIKGYMGEQYPYPTRWVKNIVVFINVYGARYIFLLFCDHQDTEF